MNRLRKAYQDFHDRFISLKGEPGAIAMGMAIGVFIGITPTIPFHTVLIILVGLIFRQNLTAAYLGSWLVSNPLTIPILYIGQYELGRLVLGVERQSFTLTDYSLSSLAALGGQILLPLLAGGVLLAPCFAVPAYFITRRLIVRVRMGKAS